MRTSVLLAWERRTIPNLVVYVPARLWRRFEKLEGAAAKDVARSVAREAILKHVSASSAPGVLAPKGPSGTSGTEAVTAGLGPGVEILDPE